MSSDSKTKYIILVPDGMADSPDPEVADRTPLKAAKTPWMDKIASAGKIGLTRTVPEGMTAWQRCGQSVDHGLFPVSGVYGTSAL